MSTFITTIERDGLKMHIFLSSLVIIRVASVILEEEHELALVDAQLSADNAAALADRIEALRKPLRTIFVSYSDPDYYFGLAVLRERFPEAKVYCTSQTRWLIEATVVAKLARWGAQLRDGAPSRIVLPEALHADHFTLCTRRIEIRRIVGDEQHAFLWIPSVRTILGGVYVFAGQHPWVADSPGMQARERWRAGLEAMIAMKPDLTIPAHFVSEKADFAGDGAIRFTHRYLSDLEEALVVTHGSIQLMHKMRSLYPGMKGSQSLETTARVLTGETQWSTLSAFPAIERRVEVDFGGENHFELDYHDERTMTFRALKKRRGDRSTTQRVEYTAVEVAPQLYMVYWSERDGTHVMHIEDYGKGIVYANIVTPDGASTNLKGILRLL